MKVALLIPVYNHPHRIGTLLRELARFELPCVVVDDGSDAPTRDVLDALDQKLPWMYLERRPRNGGRGAAMQTGYRCAARLGFTHTLQLDADGQHSPDDVPALLDAAHKHPESMILAAPVFDASAPAARLLGRQISRFWVWLETLGFDIDDPLCGLRLLPLEPVLQVLDHCGTQMEFDPELLVRLFWSGVPVVNVPARVVYFEDGISHFRPWRDNVRMSWLHTRLVVQLPLHLPGMLRRRLQGSGGTSWHERKERGSELGMRITLWLYRALGERVARVVVWGVVAYFFATDARGRRASRAYLRRVRAAGGTEDDPGGAPGLRHVFRHYLAFGTAILDRAGFWLGRRAAFRVDVRGGEELDRVVTEGRGAVVLGAHLGSFDVMRLHASTASPLVIQILMYTQHARRINRVLERLDPDDGGTRSRVRVLQIRPGEVQHALAARAAVERGEVIGILADRVHPGATSRSLEVNLLGQPAHLPRGPFALAHLLGCPVLLMLGLRKGRRHYEIRVARLPPDDPELPRGTAIARMAQRYADWLAGGCLEAPYQWFNFHDVWEDPHASR